MSFKHKKNNSQNPLSIMFDLIQVGIVVNTVNEGRKFQEAIDKVFEKLDENPTSVTIHDEFMRLAETMKTPDGPLTYQAYNKALEILVGNPDSVEVKWFVTRVGRQHFGTKIPSIIYGEQDIKNVEETLKKIKKIENITLELDVTPINPLTYEKSLRIVEDIEKNSSTFTKLYREQVI